MSLAPRCSKCHMIGCNNNNLLCNNLSQEERLVELLKLIRYECNSYSGFDGVAWASMEKDVYGEWVKFEDVVKLFVRKKE